MTSFNSGSFYRRTFSLIQGLFPTNSAKCSVQWLHLCFNFMTTRSASDMEFTSRKKKAKNSVSLIYFQFTAHLIFGLILCLSCYLSTDSVQWSKCLVVPALKSISYSISWIGKCLIGLGSDAHSSGQNYSRSSAMTDQISNLTEQSFPEIRWNDRSLNETMIDV